MYKAAVYDAPVSDEHVSWRITRTRLAIELGYTLEYIDQMSIVDLGDILSYWSVKSKIEKKASKRGGKKKAVAARRGKR